MSWRASTEKHRVPLAVDCTGESGSTDVSFTVPTDWDHFWDRVASSGADVFVTDADGRTLLTFMRSTWTYASRSGVIDVDNWTAPAAAMCLLWLYYGSGGTNSEGAFVAATPKTARIDQTNPLSNPHRVVATPQRVGDTRPLGRISKASAEEVYLDWDVRGVLLRRLDTSAGSQLDEEISYVSYVVTDSGGSTVAGMVDATKTRFPADGWVRTLIKAGTHGQDYTAALTVVTTNSAGLSRTLNLRCGIKVRDVDLVQ